MSRLLPLVAALALGTLAAGGCGDDEGQIDAADLERRLAEVERENADLRARADAPAPPTPAAATVADADPKPATDAQADGQEQRRVDALKEQLADAGVDASAPPITAPQYVDTELNVVPKEKADWVREASFREPVMYVQYVPGFDGVGGMMASDTGMGKFDVLFRWVDTGTPAMQTTATALMKAPSQYTYSGTAVWYDRDGEVSAKGTLEGGRIVGALQRFDKGGNVVATEQYDAGRKFDPQRFADADSPLVGTWVDTGPAGDGGESTRRLFNAYGPDGRVAVWSQTWSPNWRDKTKLALGKTTDPGDYAWTYKPDPDDPTRGTLEWFDGLKLVARCKLAFDGPERFRSRVTFHASPSQVGSTYDFRREVGPELASGVADARFVGTWVQDTAGEWSTTRLFNEYAADGTVTAYEQQWGYPSYRRNVPRVLKGTSEPSRQSWTFEPASGTVNWLRDGRVTSRATVAFDGPDRFTEKVTFHTDVNQVGQTFAFRRHDGTPPEGAEGAGDNPLGKE